MFNPYEKIIVTEHLGKYKIQYCYMTVAQQIGWFFYMITFCWIVIPVFLFLWCFYSDVNRFDLLPFYYIKLSDVTEKITDSFTTFSTNNKDEAFRIARKFVEYKRLKRETEQKAKQLEKQVNKNNKKLKKLERKAKITVYELED